MALHYRSRWRNHGAVGKEMTHHSGRSPVPAGEVHAPPPRAARVGTGAESMATRPAMQGSGDGSTFRALSSS